MTVMSPGSRSGQLDLSRIVHLIRPDRARLALGVMFLLLGSGMSLAYPQAIRVLIDATIGGNRETLLTATVVLAVMLAIEAVAGGCRVRLFGLVGEHLVTHLREALYQNLIIQEIGFFDERPTGELLSRLSADVSQLQRLLSTLSQVVTKALLVAGGVVLLLLTSPSLALVMVVATLGVWLGANAILREITQVCRRGQDLLAAASTVAEESFAGIRTVRSFAREQRETELYSGHVRGAFALAGEKYKALGRLWTAAKLLDSTALLIVIWLGGRQVLQGEMSPGELASCLLYTVLIVSSLPALSALWADLVVARATSQRVFELLDRTTVIPVTGGEQPAEAAGSFRLQETSFFYPARPEHEVLHGVDLRLDPGETVALVGPSGAGKTTVAALLLRLYDPTSGVVCLDGRDIRELDPSWLREQIGVVPQDPILFSTSIKENIRYARPSASDEELRAAAIAANADGFICALPDGYETRVGERGVQLSGGQKQRVAIARALLKDPRLLILDEATSSLDASSEQQVQEALQRLLVNRTSLVIAHRLSTVQSADRVVVIQAGRVVQQGTHEEMMAVDGVYRRLARGQLLSSF